MHSELPIPTKSFELQALKSYCSSQFRDINLILREEVATKPEFDEKYKKLYGEGFTSEATYRDCLHNISILDNMFNHLFNKIELVAYRKFLSTNLSPLEKDTIYIDKGFVSTSLNKNSLNNLIHSDSTSYDSIAKIIIPINTKCVYIGDIFSRKENELLLCRGLKYKFLGIEKNMYIFMLT